VVALTVVVGSVGLVAVHGFPALGHTGAGHDGIPVGDLAAVCLAVTATAATAAAALSRPDGWMRTGLMSWALPAERTPGLVPPAPARASPPVAKVLRL
jgi:hypothetical protein